MYFPYMLTVQTEEKLHEVNLSGERYRSLSLVLKIFETNPASTVLWRVRVCARRQFECRCSIGEVRRGFIVVVRCAGVKFAGEIILPVS